MTVIWTTEALENLNEIEEFIARDSPKNALIFIEALIDHGESLFQNPKIGRVVPEISNPQIRELIFKKYRLVYRISGNQIEILTVFEGHKLLSIDNIQTKRNDR